MEPFMPFSRGVVEGRPPHVSRRRSTDMLSSIEISL
jgi:hypothetical protein